MKRELTDFHIAAADLVAAYISAHDVKPERIPELLQIAYRGLLNMDAPPATLHAIPKAGPKNNSKSAPGRKPKK